MHCRTRIGGSVPFGVLQKHESKTRMQYVTVLSRRRTPKRVALWTIGSVNPMKTSIFKEYTVLYTTRIHQKTKNWQDGRLKYYHFNNRIDITNEDGHIVCSDFFSPSKPRDKIECEYLVPGHQFKTPNGSMLIEVDEMSGVHERDISAMFKKRRADDGDMDASFDNIAIKQEGACEENPIVSHPGAVHIKYENDTLVANLASRTPQIQPSQLGAKRRPVGLRRVPNDRTRDTSVPTTSLAANLSRLNLKPIATIQAESTSLSCKPPRLARIPAKSSTHFKHLQRLASRLDI